ncbi:uncharacterized protein EKO05_0010419 [Ascochyta rabiei]|uniref:uncharacterized protein n=1 Tax=Didymella rabiei TaxID=5454 RepID=UPI0021FD28AA|nr:uncharacterized protein EKO05_0010419 [Ascochyta rabiei]UPX20178.1 hypothetical protein EKO05_0010419 [Ascochyta rabiei]
MHHEEAYCTANELLLRDDSAYEDIRQALYVCIPPSKPPTQSTQHLDSLCVACSSFKGLPYPSVIAPQHGPDSTTLLLTVRLSSFEVARCQATTLLNVPKVSESVSKAPKFSRSISHYHVQSKQLHVGPLSPSHLKSACSNAASPKRIHHPRSLKQIARYAVA